MIEIREEKISEQRETENVVREAFWNVYSPGCSDHYLVHQVYPSIKFSRRKKRNNRWTCDKYKILY